ncbi:hypothetical protein K435DRAFT_808021 [Dendrothele bispora CBS 962.96]|uniref:Uncharacterized protein n=1 Tax=Dendrothele bispora (strain CBS 962.96) TaxID=1314807 RepID=A0A4S8L388_DENBC|nr:hypothetical protein K435DRAFT_808021 [Dendrothele bispora CBS 962.96]
MSTVSAKSNGRSYEGHGLDRFTEEDAYGGIRNDDDEEPEVQLTRMRLSISPMPPSPEPGASNPPSSFHFKGKSGNKDRELLSAVSMNDLPPSSDIEDDNPVDKRKSNASIGSVSTASSIVILQSSLRRKKPKRISIGDVEHSTVYPLSSPVLSPTSNVSSVLSPRTPLTPSLTTPPPSAFLLTRTPPTPLTPAFTEGMNPINTTTGETLSPGSSPTTTTTSSPAYPSPPSSFSSYNEKVASVPTTPPPTTTASESLFAEAQSQSPQSNAIDPHALHRELRSARSRSRGHRERLGMRHNSGVDAEMPTPPLPTTPSSGPLTPSSELEPITIAKSQPVGPGKVVEPKKRAPRLRSRSRSKSPDISTLLTETRERARSQSRSAAKSRASSASGTSTPLGRGASSRRRQSAKRRESEGYSSTHHDRYQHPPSSYSFAGEEGLNRRASDGMQPSTSSSTVVRGRKTSQRKLGHVYPREDEEEERRINKLERQLDGDPNGSDSDSDEEMKDRRGFGFDGVERVRDSVDDIFGEYLDESVAGSGDDEPVRGGNWEEEEGDQDSDSSLDLHTPLP